MKKALALIGLAVLAITLVVLIRTARFTSKQLTAKPAEPVGLDRQALATRLAQALRFRTISHQDPGNLDREEFLSLHRYLAEQFPLVHARLQHETVNDYSLLYTWPGREPGRKPIILLAHLDVVPVEPGTEEKWHHPPFDGRIADGYLWGRGALDDVEIRPLPGAREPSAEAPVEASSFALLQRTIRAVFPGAVIAPYLTIGGTDARNYAPLTNNIYRFTPIIADPSDLLRIHGTNERLSLENYERSVQFFVQLIKNSGA
jgi:acetylornithine deacetylase/succinyl-diaminopimelate desuccinylase-like protein